MVERALRQIEDDLRRLAGEEEFDRDAIRLAARRIGAQAEMLEQGVEP